MMTRIWIALLGLALSSAAPAVPITFQADGVIGIVMEYPGCVPASSLPPGSSPPPGVPICIGSDLQVGDTVRFTWTFDSGATGTPSGPYSQRYPLLSATVTLFTASNPGGLAYSITGGTVDVFNGAGTSPVDGYNLDLTGSLTLPGGAVLQYPIIRLGDLDATVFSSTALPLTLPPLSAFEQRLFFLNNPIYPDVSGTLTSLVRVGANPGAVPAPAPLALLLAGVPGLLWRRGRV